MSPLATWAGPFDAVLPDGTRLNIGDKFEVSDAQLESGHWKRTDAPVDTLARPAAPQPPSEPKADS